MKYNFDEIIPRRGTNSYKWDSAGDADVLPMWVADMDFRTAPPVVEALRKRVEHGIFGYVRVQDAYYAAVTNWFARRHDWQIEKEWIIYTTGVVPALSAVIKALTAPGDKVMVQTPVYNCFFSSIRNNGCGMIANPLIYRNGTYQIDFADLEQKAADPSVKVLLLCNPHNPAGIVWDVDTLRRLADFCYERGIIVISDEIHCDMALYGNKHHPFASVSEKAAHCSITFMAPSKTFNIAGIVSSFCVVPDEKLRSKFFSWLTANELDEPHLFAPIATIAAYREGEEWRRQMLRYVEGNIDFVISWLKENLPQVRALRPQASFLVWLDCRALGLDHDALIDLFVNRARLALNDGEMFGMGGKGFMRMNVAAPRSVLKEALERLASAIRIRN